MPRRPGETIDQITQQCIDACTSCHEVCLETLTYCLSQGGKHVEPEHFRLMIDCEELCEETADFMMRGSNWDARLCELCSDVCNKCADSCAQFTGDDRMLACAQSCRNCAEACRLMVQHHGKIAA